MTEKQAHRALAVAAENRSRFRGIADARAERLILGDGHTVSSSAVARVYSAMDCAVNEVEWLVYRQNRGIA